MTQKFGREYRLTLDLADGKPPIVIQLPFTVQFWIQRNTLSDLNRLDIDVYNLSESNRNRIFQDRFDLTTNRTLILEAGYTTLYRIFAGRIWRASSAREGTNIVTRIEARDGSFDVATSQTYQTFQQGQTLGDVLKFLAGQFPTLEIGAIGSYPQVLQRPLALNGATYDLLKKYSDNQMFIDNGKIYILADSEVLEGKAILINDASGLLDTPRRDEGFLSVTTLMEAGVQIKQVVKLESSVQPVYNGDYAVIGVIHQGVISAAICGECRSTFQLLAPNQFKQFTTVKSQ